MSNGGRDNVNGDGAAGGRDDVNATGGRDGVTETGGRDGGRRGNTNGGRGSMAGARVVIFGLGRHGGGIASAKWCVAQGGRVSVYDRQPAAALRESIAQLAGLPIDFRCGVDDPELIRNADIVIKNPAVPRSAPLLRHARRIETDLSLLLRHRLPTTIAVTGTKGKSSVVSAIDHALSRLGITHATVGNIGNSIFSALERLSDISVLLLELSSFQLGDLTFVRRFNRERGTEGEPWPDVAVCTNLYPDHLNYYASMAEYMADKSVIAAHQRDDQWLVLNGAREQQTYRNILMQSGVAQVALVEDGREGDANDGAKKRDEGRAIAGRVWQYGSAAERKVRIDLHGEQSRHSLRTAALGGAMEYNLSVAYAALRCAGAIEARADDEPLFADWRGIAHRMERVGESARIVFINDTAATIPHAVRAGIAALKAPIYLIAGGSDKGIEIDLFAEIAATVRRLFLLEGDATMRIVELLRAAGSRYEGPFASLPAAFKAMIAAITEDGSAARDENAATPDEIAIASDALGHSAKAVALLSPGCASFGMFAHEFDRGQQYRDLVRQYLKSIKP